MNVSNAFSFLGRLWSTSLFRYGAPMIFCVLMASFCNMFAQSGGTASPSPQISSSHKKNRIVFDYSQPPKVEKPAEVSQPSATPENTPQKNEDIQVEDITDPLTVAAEAEKSENTKNEKKTESAPSLSPSATPVATPSPSAPSLAAGATNKKPLPANDRQAVPASSVVASEKPSPVSAPSATPSRAAAAPNSVLMNPSVNDQAAKVSKAQNSAGGVSPADTNAAVESINVNTLSSGNPPAPATPSVSAADATGKGENTPSQSVTTNLIRKLVDRGILSKEDAEGMIKQAEAEADAAREQNQADMFAIAQAAVTQGGADQAMVSQATVQTSSEDVKVTYIPEPVKTQIREDIKHELLAEARAGRLGIGTQPVLPLWVSRIHPFADFRFRYEGIFYPEGNDNTGAFPNFNAINTGPPFDVTGNQFSPQYNVDQNRQRFRIRALFGAQMDLTDHLVAGLQIGTGETNSPVSENQTVGLANQGQGGQFSNYAIWLERAYVNYVIGDKPTKSISFWIGRFNNPFFSTPLIWDDELGFDGVAVQAQYEIIEGLTPFITAGAFPVYNTDLNFSSNQPEKFQSYDKYLYGAQVGVNWKPNKNWDAKVATAFYYFQNIEGKLSTPYTPLTQSDAGDTDNSRPSFAQKGNTYMALRDIIPDASNDFGAINQWQYYGLATPFHDFAVTGRINYNGFEPVQVSLIGEFVQNLAFDSAAINEVAVNNRGPADTLSNPLGAFEGSPTAWMVDLKVGTPLLEKLWDWNVLFGYRYIGSDSVVDGFNDSDFGLGGTNMKGLTVGAALALNANVWLGARWMGADSIAGPTYKVNIFQFDFHTKF